MSNTDKESLSDVVLSAVKRNRVMQAVLEHNTLGLSMLSNAARDPHALDVFDRIFCINLDRSPLRWSACLEAARAHGFDHRLNRFHAYDFHEWDTVPQPHLRASMCNAMCGCSHSHSGLMHVIAHNLWQSTLVLEDDFEVLHADFLDRFATAWAEVPDDWDIVYLGGGYGYTPTERISQHVVRANYIKTTSSYAIHLRHARLMAPILAACCGPDDTFSGYNPHVNAYILHPRLLGQRSCPSDIFDGKVTHNTQSMTDPHHDALVESLPYQQAT